MARQAKMTRVHFQLIADTIGDLDLNNPRHEHVINAFANALRSTNCNFQSGRFVERCRKVRQDNKAREKVSKQRERDYNESIARNHAYIS